MLCSLCSPMLLYSTNSISNVKRPWGPRVDKGLNFGVKLYKEIRILLHQLNTFNTHIYRIGSLFLSLAPPPSLSLSPGHSGLRKRGEIKSGIACGDERRGGGVGVGEIRGWKNPDRTVAFSWFSPPANPNPELPTYSNTGYWIWLKYEL